MTSRRRYANDTVSFAIKKGTVLSGVHMILHSWVLLYAAMCDFITAATEFMVRVLHSRLPLDAVAPGMWTPAMRLTNTMPLGSIHHEFFHQP
jgi:hypothetical protein